MFYRPNRVQSIPTDVSKTNKIINQIIVHGFCLVACLGVCVKLENC